MPSRRMDFVGTCFAVAGSIIDKLQQQNADLMRALARDAAGCKGRRT